MKKICALILSLVMVAAMAVAMTPASAIEYLPGDNVLLITQEMIDAAKAENSDVSNIAKYQQWGCGNVFYYDYLNYVADGNTPSGKDPGSGYALRINTYSGSGSAQMCDGNKTSSTTIHHFSKEELYMLETDKFYDHAFGYSFKEPVTVDSFTFYTSTKTDEAPALITGVDIFGGARTESGETVYFLLWSSGDKNIQESLNEDGVAFVEGTFEPVKLDYIRYAVTTDANAPSRYKVYECELFATEKAHTNTYPAVAETLPEEDETTKAPADETTKADDVTNAPDDATQAPDDATQAPDDNTTKAPPADNSTGCASSVAYGIGLVAIIGSALLIKKRK
jgi:hypothetical protein